MDLSDKDIVRKIKEGQINYFSHIVKKYTKPIFSYVRSKLFDKDETEDIVQDSFFKFYKAITRFDENRPILPYLYQIARNELKMYFRSHKDTVQLNELTAQEKKGDEYSPEDVSDAWSLVSELPQTEQKALHWLADGYTYAEIAKRLEKPVNTVKTIVRRARLQLHKIKHHEKS